MSAGSESWGAANDRALYSPKRLISSSPTALEFKTFAHQRS